MMKYKVFYSVIAFSVMSVMCVSCETEVIQKVAIGIGDNIDSDTSVASFNASIDDSFSLKAGRTAISASPNEEGTYSLNWQAGDEISISEGNNTAVYMTEGTANTVTFSRKSGYISNTAEKYVAFFPSSLTPQNLKLPAEQEYVSGNVKNYPMYAESSDKHLSFKNLCGILRLSLKNTDTGREVAVKSVSIAVDGQGLSGSFTIDASHAAVVTGEDGVKLTCGSPVTLTSVANDFNVIVPKGTYNAMKIKVTTQDGKVVLLEGQTAVNIYRSGITKVNIALKAADFTDTLEVITFTESDVEFTER